MQETTTIVLEVELAEEPLSGTVRAGQGPAREFTGRLGLMRAIDQLLAEASGDQEETA